MIASGRLVGQQRLLKFYEDIDNIRSVYYIINIRVIFILKKKRSLSKMGKSFRNEYDDDDSSRGGKKSYKNSKRHKVKDYLRRIDVDAFDEEEFEKFANDDNE